MASPVEPSTARSEGPLGPRTSASPPPSQDWTVQVADTIESVVGSVRDKTAVPLETLARAVVYGILIIVMAAAAMVLLTIALVRAGSYVLPIWAVYAIVGGFFTLAGLFLWRKRRPAAPADTKR
ncbi:MAG: phage holin family protein [Actinobacteria bacterium]|nr:phage holin family protein [Actinomycetota bacterium]MBW3649918.1 phage holin family protein [Actinomycetota bacterium]